MQKKSVLHILPHPGGGAEVYISMLGRTRSFSHERLYLSAGRSPRSAAMSVPTQLPKLAARVWAADLVHVHGDAAAIITLPLLPVRPSVVTTHGLHLLRRSEGIRRSAVGRALQLAIATARAVIATSTIELQEITSLARAKDAAKLQVILNGVDPPPHRDGGDRDTIRAELGVGPDVVLGMFVGQLEERKEPLLAIAAAERVQQAGLPFVLAVAGEGPLSGAVCACSSRSLLPLGYRADVDRLLAAADVFLLPSSREGMSLALLEAMSHGLAVIAADAPGTAEAIGDTGLLFPTGDEAALARAISHVVSNSELRQSLGAGGRRRALDSFGADRCVAQTAGVYQSLAGVATLES